MKIPAAHILRDFVDRTRELAGFQQSLGAGEKRIICIQGPGGIGKSALLSRMMLECQQKQLRWVHLEWEDSHRYTHLDIMRQLRDGTEPEAFQLFNDRVNYYTVPNYELKIPVDLGAIEKVQILEGGEIRQSGVTVHVGHQVTVHDVKFNVQRPDRDITETEFVLQVTRAFVQCLRALSERTPLVLFLDALEKTDPFTLSWINEQLLTRLRDGELPKVMVVLAGRKAIDLDPTFFDCSDAYELLPFKTTHVLEYLERRGLPAQPELADFILANFGGNPLQIALSVNNFLRTRRQRSADD